MTVFRNSRYRNQKYYQVEDQHGGVQQIMELREIPVGQIAGCTQHLVRADETMEVLAFKYYGDAAKWYVIADANPQVFFPLDLQPGMMILIPPLTYARLA